MIVGKNSREMQGFALLARRFHSMFQRALRSPSGLLRSPLTSNYFFYADCRGLSGRSATSIVASYACSFRLMRSRTQFAPLARVRSLTPAPLRVHPLEGSLSRKLFILREHIFYLAIPKALLVRRPPKGSRGRRSSPLGITPKVYKWRPEGVKGATVKPLGINIQD